jgi:hypothetical protein
VGILERCSVGSKKEKERKVCIYLNLSNGIEYLENARYYDSFIRIQSTALEQKRWDFVIQELDYNFLIDCVTGKSIIVVDFSAKRNISRALWQGVPFIEYVLNKYVLGVEDAQCFFKKHNATKYIDEVISKFEKRTLKKLDYLKKFATTERVVIDFIGDRTEHDGDYGYYKDILKHCNEDRRWE